ncbi:hypothetical protein MMC21_002427 [Puttea exsequens]|nr:hypothetical protein [Puttea exsequens]
MARSNARRRFLPRNANINTRYITPTQAEAPRTQDINGVDDLDSSSDDDTYKLARAIASSQQELATAVDGCNSNNPGPSGPSQGPDASPGPSGSPGDIVEDGPRRPKSSPARDVFGSNENVYNPYNPYKHPAFVQQEVAAGRMSPRHLQRSDVNQLKSYDGNETNKGEAKKEEASKAKVNKQEANVESIVEGWPTLVKSHGLTFATNRPPRQTGLTNEIVSLKQSSKVISKISALTSRLEGDIQQAHESRKRRHEDMSPAEIIAPSARGLALRRPEPNLSPRSTLNPHARPFVPGRPDHPKMSDMLLKFPPEIRTKLEEFINPLSPTFSTPQLQIPLNRDPQFIFISEIYPRRWPKRKRKLLHNIFRTKTPYVPTAISIIPKQPPIQYFYTKGPIPPDFHAYESPLDSNGEGWPGNSLPVEVFHNIAAHLSREDICQMRLVNREFEAKVSNPLFRRVVVPFRPEIYGLLVHKDLPVQTVDIKGKGKAKQDAVEEDTAVKDVNDGMKVFQSWGPHINQFAMAFEIDEDQLTNPPVKAKFEDFKAFWGTYKWPHPYYSRFEICAMLEKKADEFRCMSMALSSLSEIRDLGLSIDSGLGWLAGPDISDRAQLFKDKPSVFGRPLIHNSKDDERNSTWQGIVRSFTSRASSYFTPVGTHMRKDQIMEPNDFGFFEIHIYEVWDEEDVTYDHFEERVLGRRIDFRSPREDIQSSSNHPLIFQGVNLSDIPADRLTTAHANLLDTSHCQNSTPFSSAPLRPNQLQPAQKELLLETEWAQRAFLSSFCMALSDNTEAFQNVQKLTIAKLSSRYLSAIQRDDFWNALPQLRTLNFFVSPDFRDIRKTDIGAVETVDLDPSQAATQFYALIRKCISTVPSIKTLVLGYTGGGEQQTGIFGRNRHVLPAPLTDCTDPGAQAQGSNISGILKRDPNDILKLPYVEHLTLANCWIAPPTLKDFVTLHRAPNMQTLTLDSVSLSAHSGFVMDAFETAPSEDPSFSAIPDGQPRLFSPTVGNLYQQRGNAPHPDLSKPATWVLNGARIGSWRNVIDSITPGPTIDFLRWVYRHTDSYPSLHRLGTLQRIIFKSCGYVKLTARQPNNTSLNDLDQAFLGLPATSPPPCLQKRALELMPVMMHRNEDKLLGQIIPSLSEHELDVFESAWPMKVGWADNEAAEKVLEDGQPRGGTGRFSGSVEKIVFPQY